MLHWLNIATWTIRIQRLVRNFSARSFGKFQTESSVWIRKISFQLNETAIIILLILAGDDSGNFVLFTFWNKNGPSKSRAFFLWNNAQFFIIGLTVIHFPLVKSLNPWMMDMYLHFEALIMRNSRLRLTDKPSVINRERENSVMVQLTSNRNSLEKSVSRFREKIVAV